MNGMTPQEVLAIRQRLNVSQEEMAMRLGVNERTVRRWENEGCHELAARLMKSLAQEESANGQGSESPEV